MSLWIEIVVMFLVFMAAWCGLALAKASSQREEHERECYSDPARPRVVQTTAHAARATRLHDRSSHARALQAARDQAESVRRAQGWARPQPDPAARRRAEIGVGGDAA